jgi:REP element-mobilizing transposase RayT
MPPRPPIDPTGTYHVGSRGTYGQPLFETVGEHECFLRMYARVARTYAWITIAWVLMWNHHHFVVQLTDGGLSDGMRELHGGYSRWIHAMYGQTRKGHLFRHAFFGRQIRDEDDLVETCAYVDLNPSKHRPTATPLKTDWGGYVATLGLEHPRSFHTPSALLEVLDPSPAVARRKYQAFVEAEHARRRQVPSPNDVPELVRSAP